jgi:hypothetical protein
LHYSYISIFQWKCFWGKVVFAYTFRFVQRQYGQLKFITNNRMHVNLIAGYSLQLIYKEV